MVQRPPSNIRNGEIRTGGTRNFLAEGRRGLGGAGLRDKRTLFGPKERAVREGKGHHALGALIDKPGRNLCTGKGKSRRSACSIGGGGTGGFDGGSGKLLLKARIKSVLTFS